MNEIAKSFSDADPLSSVVFIHDYVQLVFQELGLNIYAPCAVTTGTRTNSSGEAGYADDLVSLIGQSVRRVEDRGNSIRLIFDSDTSVQIAPYGSGPEAFSINQEGRPTIVG
jgi:hypothetical protein